MGVRFSGARARASFGVPLASLLLMSCLGSVTGLSEQELGRAETDRIERTVGFVSDPALLRYVGAIGHRLVQHAPAQGHTYRFHVIDTAEPNALALPGGFIFVSRGLLAQSNSESELAGVIGHEIGHVIAQHGAKRDSVVAPFAIVTGMGSWATGLVSNRLAGLVGGVGGLAGGLVIAPYSRSQEREADRIGQKLAAAAGYDPAGLSDFLKTLQRYSELKLGGPSRKSFLDSHPSEPERVRQTQEHAQKLDRISRPFIAGGHRGFLNNLVGLRVGGNPAHGQFVEGRFVQPTHGFSMEVPKGWTSQLGRDFLALSPRVGDALIVLNQARGKTPAEAAHIFSDRARIRYQAEARSLTIHGLPAAQADADVSENRMRLTWVLHQGLVWQIVGLSRAVDFELYAPTFAASTGSFREITSGERAALRDLRLRIRQSRAGESVGRLTSRSRSSWSPEQIAVANALDFQAVLSSGQMIKVPLLEPYKE